MNKHRPGRTELEQVDWILLDIKQSAFKPQIYFLDWQGAQLCIKDFSGCNTLVRNTLGRWIVNREASILEALKDIPGVPAMISVIEGPALVMNRVDASVLPRPHRCVADCGTCAKDNGLSPDFFSGAFNLLARLHERGVAHGDIHNTNLLLHRDGQASLIDFASALLLSNKVSAMKRWAWRTLARIDRISLLNLRQDHFPDHPLTQEEQCLLNKQPGVYRLHKGLRSIFIKPVKRFFRSR